MISKRGGDINQANYARQTNFSSFDFASVFPYGAGMEDDGDDGWGGQHSQHGHRGSRSFPQQTVFASIQQTLSQNNVGFGGNGGSDNFEAGATVAFAY